MLREIIRKDLVLNRNAILLNNGIFAVMVAFMAHEKMGGTQYGFISSLLFSFPVITVLVREDKFKARALGCSLPVTGRRIVAGRYVLGLGAGLVGAALALLLPVVLPSSPIPTDEILNATTLLTSLTTVTLVTAVLIPFTIRFGLMGILVFLVGMQVLGVAAFSLARAFEGSMGPQHVIGAVADAVRAAHAFLGATAFAIALLACLAVVAGISCQASMALFERRRMG